VVYGLTAEGRRLTSWNDGRDVVVYDGTGDATRALAAARANLESLWKSIQLERVNR